MRVRLAKNGGLFGACSGFPACKATINMPKGISGIRMLDQNCPKCKNQRKDVKMFELEFDTNLVNEVMAEMLPN